MVVIGGVIPPDDVPTLKEMGAAAVFLPGTVIAESALDLLARLRDQLDHGARPRRRRPRRGHPRAAPVGGLAGDHAGRVVQARAPGRRARAADRAGAGRRLRRPLAGGAGRHLRRARASGSRRSSRRSAPGSPPRATGSACWRSTRPASAPAGRCSATRPGWRGCRRTRDAYIRPVARGRDPRRRRPRHRAGDGGARGRGLRRGAGRDRRRRAVRGHRGRDGRHLPLPHPGPHRRPAAGHQEGHPRDRRRDRGQQGRRRPRGRGAGRRPRAGRARCGWCAASGEWAPPVVTCLRAARRRRRRAVAPGARPPRPPRRRRAWPPSAPSSSSTSPGRWSATSSTSGCAARRRRAGSATRCAPPYSPASCRAPVAADRLLAAYDESPADAYGVSGDAHRVTPWPQPQPRPSPWQPAAGPVPRPGRASPGHWTPACVGPLSVAVAEDGGIWYSENYAGLLHHRAPDGKVTTPAGRRPPRAEAVSVSAARSVRRHRGRHTVGKLHRARRRRRRPRTAPWSPTSTPTSAGPTPTDVLRYGFREPPPRCAAQAPPGRAAAYQEGRRPTRSPRSGDTARSTSPTRPRTRSRRRRRARRPRWPCSRRCAPR